LVDLANIQVKSHDVHVLIINDLCTESLFGKLAEDIVVTRFKRVPGSRKIGEILNIYWQIFQCKPDIVHIHSADLLKMIPPFGYNIVLTVHDTVCELRCSGRIKATVAISRAVADDLAARCRIDCVTTIQNGVPCTKIRIRDGIGNDPFKIIQVGRLLHEKKGQDVLLNAVRIVEDKSGIPVHLHFLGDGPSRDYLRTLAETLGLQHVEFLGEKEREVVFDCLSDYSLFVQPSRSEGFGLTVVEAMAAKIPVLVSNIEGPYELIRNDTYGFSFRSEDVEHCASKIIQIMDLYRNDSDALLQLTERAYDYAIENYDINRMAMEYELLYKSIAA